MRILFAVAFATLTSAAPVPYIAIDIGTMGGLSAVAFGLNDAGQVTGNVGFSGGSALAFLYSYAAGTMTGVGTPTGHTSVGYAINGSGNITGQVTNTGTGTSSTFFYDGTFHDLGTFGTTGSVGHAINASDQIAGRAGSQAYFYNGTATTITPGAAFGLNASGTTVGGELGGFFSYNGALTTIAPVGWSQLSALAINASGAIVGLGRDGLPLRAFLYESGVMTDLGSLGGPTRYSAAYAINDAGWIVGYSESSFLLPVAFLYEAGTMYDLNTLVISGLPVTTRLQEARGVNASNQIIANGSDGRAYLLTPIGVPEPSTAAMAGLALLAIATKLAWSTQTA
jgi:probable HAF family extracellular repeat protein